MRNLDCTNQEWTMTELVSISDAAKKLGIPRPTLSRIIKELKIDTSRNGKTKLVCLNTCQNHIQTLAAQGRLHVRKRPQTDQEQNKQQQKSFDIVYEELKIARLERDKLKEKNEVLQSELFELRGEIKLLKGAVTKEKDNAKKRSSSWLEKGKNIVKAISLELK